MDVAAATHGDTMHKKKLVWAAIALLLLAVFCGCYFRHYLQTPAGNAQSVPVDVRPGQRMRLVLEDLEHKGVLLHAKWLYVYARAFDKTQLRSGYYQIDGQQSPLDILTTLVEGRVVLESFTVAEGLNRWQIRDLLVAHQWLSASQFDALCDNPSFLQANGVFGPTCEGYLFPETYTFARGVAPEAIFAQMFASFKQAFEGLQAQPQWREKMPMALDEKQIVTLASIVEKETGAPSEREHIACVFYNRMRAKPAWRLETDPTVIYAATLTNPQFDGNLTRQHLHGLNNPYNTYRVYGLPPGPIASPGLAALRAVLAPSACADFFFVSTNHGQHIFCPTLQCHEQAVRKWQINYFKRARNAAASGHPKAPNKVKKAVEVSRP